jgi:serine/threonine-protein kinase
MLAGRPPFTEGDIAYQHFRVPARPISEIPDQLNSIILKCLAKNKEDRWSTARELAEALRQFLSEWQENRVSSQ